MSVVSYRLRRDRTGLSVGDARQRPATRAQGFSAAIAVDIAQTAMATCRRERLPRVGDGGRPQRRGAGADPR